MIKGCKLLFSLFFVLILQACGYEMIQYQSNPSITIRFNTENVSHSSVLDTLEQFAVKRMFKFGYYKSYLQNGYVTQMQNKKVDIFASPDIDVNDYSVHLNNSRIPWRKMSDEELFLLAKEFEVELLKIENVKLVSFEVFD